MVDVCVHSSSESTNISILRAMSGPHVRFAGHERFACTLSIDRRALCRFREELSSEVR